MDYQVFQVWGPMSGLRQLEAGLKASFTSKTDDVQTQLLSTLAWFLIAEDPKQELEDNLRSSNFLHIIHITDIIHT